MHHFIIEESLGQDTGGITITDQRLVHQRSRVLRFAPGTSCVLQYQSGDISHRWTVQIVSFSHDDVTCTITSCQKNVNNLSKTLYIALPNNAQKLDMIVQKCTEVGIGSIVFRGAARSQRHELAEKKIMRLGLIAREATEQSKRRFVPDVRFQQELDLKELSGNTIYYHQEGVAREEYIPDEAPVCAIVGPEGGFSPEELLNFSMNEIEPVALGGPILRMETAAVVGGWLLEQW